jgi:aspartate aminotransferase
MVGEIQKRKDFIVDALNQISGVKCFSPEGSFYVFPNSSGIYGHPYKRKKRTSSPEFIDDLLDEANVAAVLGAEFGRDSQMRLSYATSLKHIIGWALKFNLCFVSASINNFFS